jgi:hypothetical protein
MNIKRWLALTGFTFGLFAVALAQSTWPTQVLFQGTTAGQVIQARTPVQGIAFTFTLGTNYPPASFPALYKATNLDKGVMPFQVYSTVPGTWSLLLEIPDLRNGTGKLLVPAKQIMYRVNGGPWFRANGAPQIIYTQVGPTRDWQDLQLEFQIELLGDESAGQYVAQALFSALTQP